MIDIDELDRIAKAGDPWGYAATPANVIELIAEVRALRDDAERYRWAISLEDNAETLLGAVMSCGPTAAKEINIEIDAARMAAPAKEVS